MGLCGAPCAPTGAWGLAEPAGDLSLALGPRQGAGARASPFSTTSCRNKFPNTSMFLPSLPDRTTKYLSTQKRPARAPGSSPRPVAGYSRALKPRKPYTDAPKPAPAPVARASPPVPTLQQLPPTVHQAPSRSTPQERPPRRGYPAGATLQSSPYSGRHPARATLQRPPRSPYPADATPQGTLFALLSPS